MDFTNSSYQSPPSPPQHICWGGVWGEELISPPPPHLHNIVSKMTRNDSPSISSPPPVQIFLCVEEFDMYICSGGELYERYKMFSQTALLPTLLINGVSWIGCIVYSVYRSLPSSRFIPRGMCRIQQTESSPDYFAV